MRVKIQIDDNGRKADIEIDEAENLEKLIIIQNVFKLFGIDTDVLEMTSTFQKVGSAYAKFFNEVKPIEIINDEKSKRDIKAELTQGLILSHEELKTTYAETKDQPEHYITGIKYSDDGTKRYQLFYWCPMCRNRGRHYVPQDSKTTWCHACNHTMEIFHVHPRKPFPERDTFGNYYRAGEYQDKTLFSHIEY